MSTTDYTTLTEEELRAMRSRAELELERRRIEEHGRELAESQASKDDLEYLEQLWAGAAGGSLTDSQQCVQALHWLWSATYLAHEAQYWHAPTVRHLGRALYEHLEALVLGGGGEDTTDVRDMGEPPRFGGRGCTCELYDSGGPESGPQLGVDLNEGCPLHSHLLGSERPDYVSEAGSAEGLGWPGEATLCTVHEAGACPPGCPHAYREEVAR